MNHRLAGRRVAVLTFVMVALLASRDLWAQCGARRTECALCHDGSRAPGAAGGLWHLDHEFADLCAVCHGGDGDATSADEAHARLVTTLAGMQDACDSCHGEATGGLLERYRGAARRLDAARGAAAATGPHPSDASPGTIAAPSIHGARGPNLVAGAAALLIALAGALAIRRSERALEERPLRRSDPPVESMGGPGGARSVDRVSSPIVAGIGLGLVVTVSTAVFGHRLSGAGAYQHLSGYVGRPLAPASSYWRHVVPTGVTWEVLGLLGAVLGAFAAARLAGEFAVRTMPDRQWADVFGPSVVRRWALAFAGSFLTELAGGIAGGCTASLAVSGGAVLAPGAFLFMAGMFAGGIPVAFLLYRKHAGRGV